jgi:transposase-like protein
MSNQRRFSLEEKYNIVVEAHQPGVTTAELCHRHGITCGVFHRWEAQMRNGAKEALLDKRGGKKRLADLELDRLRNELAKKNDVIAELTDALIQEKRGSRTICSQTAPPRK